MSTPPVPRYPFNQGDALVATGLNASFDDRMQVSLLPVNMKNKQVIGDGVTLDTAAIKAALANGASDYYFPPGNYLIDDMLTLPDTVKKITLAQGATIIQSVDKPIWFKQGMVLGSSIPIVGAPTRGSDFFSVNAGTYNALNVDDWVYIRGSNKTPNVTAGSAVGCLRKLTQINSASNVIFFDAALYRDWGSGSLLRMYKIQLGGKVIFEGGNYVSNMNQTNFSTLFDFQLCEAPDFNGVSLGNSGGPGIALAHCVGGSFNHSYIHDLLDDIPNGHAGYAVVLRGACRGFAYTSGVVTKTRHAITTLSVFSATSYQPTDPAYPDLAGTGEPESITYGPAVYAYNTTSVAFDTHEQGYDIRIIPNAHGCFDGVELRCSDAVVMGGNITNCRRAGIRIEVPASNPTATVTMNHKIYGTTISNVGIQGVQSYGILGDAAGAYVDIADVKISGYQTAGVYGVNGLVYNIVDSTIDGGVASNQDGLQLLGPGSRIHGGMITNNKNGINNVNGDFTEYRHLRLVGNINDIVPATSKDGLNLHSAPSDLFLSGRWYGSNGSVSTSGTLGNGVFQASPFLVSRTTTFTAIAAEVTIAGSSGAAVRLGIYQDAGGYPGSLTFDAGSIDGTVVGAQQLAVNVTLRPGVYWIGAAVQGSPATQPTLRTIIGGSQLTGASSLSAATGSATVGYSQAAPGALPATFVAGSDAVGAVPRVVMLAQ